MDRRAFIGGAAAAALGPTAAYAQMPATARRVGLLMTTTPTAAAHIVVAFADGLRELGHVEGKNVLFEYRWAAGDRERFAEMAADLVRQHVDVLVASSQAAALAAQRATRTIPIVMVNATDPVQAGLVASLAQPGANVTGLSQQLTREIRAKQLQLLKEALPKMSRVAVLHSVATTVGLREYEAAGQTLAVRVQVVEIRNRDALAPAFAAMQRVADLAREHRLPGMYSTREYAEVGGLMSYAARLSEQFRRAAYYVHKILRGASPATLPIESPSHYELVINIKTAKALGLTIPHSLLQRADQVLE